VEQNVSQISRQVLIFEHFLPKTSKNLGIFLSTLLGGKGGGNKNDLQRVQ
jgi:hypothetical protein